MYKPHSPIQMAQYLAQEPLCSAHYTLILLKCDFLQGGVLPQLLLLQFKGLTLCITGLEQCLWWGGWGESRGDWITAQFHMIKVKFSSVCRTIPREQRMKPKLK